MICRYAFFVGTVREGMDEAMRDYVMETLLPLWRRFDGAEQVRVLFGVEQDPDGDPIPLVLAISYQDEAAMNKALESPARYEAKELLPGFFERFLDGHLLHYVMEINSFEPDRS